MLFNSFEFFVFLPVVFILYWFVIRRRDVQNVFIIIVSYIFYGWYDWRFLLLIILTSFSSYYTGQLVFKYKSLFDKSNHTIDRYKKISKAFAALNIVLSLLILCTFKYYHFFSENLNRLFNLFGLQVDWVTINILLPVGISFYTFQALSYTIDVYKGKVVPRNDIAGFFAFISFFPQLVAGPIERATNLLPQFYKKRSFEYTYALSGLRQMLWGFFKKMVVADNAAIIANFTFENSATASGATLFIGLLMFAFQIYGDFSGYSDIAIGCAKLFGFELKTNFLYPYFSRDIAEYWRRWHISLNTWIRDYIYIPLGGSRKTKQLTIRNTIIIFLISGLWHGANWTFIFWGAYHAILFIPLLLVGKNRQYTGSIVAENRTLPSLNEFVRIIITFILVLIGWIIFRADNLTHAFNYWIGLCDRSLFSLPVIPNKTAFASAITGIIIMIYVEWIFRRCQFGLDFEHKKSTKLHRRLTYILLVLTIIYLATAGQEFIYFRF